MLRSSAGAQARIARAALHRALTEWDVAIGRLTKIKRKG